MAQRDEPSSLSPDERHSRDAALALQYVERTFTSDDPPNERDQLTAIATAIDHGATLDDLAAATGHSVQTLRRIAIRLGRGERPEPA